MPDHGMSGIPMRLLTVPHLSTWEILELAKRTAANKVLKTWVINGTNAASAIAV